jgi:L-ribulose-5-phosphate 4-epimerase
MTDREIEGEYEKNTGLAIVRALETLDEGTPGILVANHGPFTWGPDAITAAHNAAILESLARMAYFTTTLNQAAEPVGRALHNKHYLRKHGKNAYYGQANEKNGVS